MLQVIRFWLESCLGNRSAILNKLVSFSVHTTQIYIVPLSLHAAVFPGHFFGICWNASHISFCFQKQTDQWPVLFVHLLLVSHSLIRMYGYSEVFHWHFCQGKLCFHRSFLTIVHCFLDRVCCQLSRRENPERQTSLHIGNGIPSTVFSFLLTKCHQVTILNQNAKSTYKILVKLSYNCHQP